jgi:hypothetical protein
MVSDPPLPRLGDAPPYLGGMTLWLAWVGSVLILLLALAVLWLFRADLVAAWPPAARLFSALGVALH